MTVFCCYCYSGKKRKAESAKGAGGKKKKKEETAEEKALKVLHSTPLVRSLDKIV